MLTIRICDIPDTGEEGCWKTRDKYKTGEQKRQLLGEKSYHELAGSVSMLK